MKTTGLLSMNAFPFSMIVTIRALLGVILTSPLLIGWITPVDLLKIIVP